MNPLKKLSKFIGRMASAAKKKIRGTYDVAQTTPENEDYWAWTDSLNANAANSPTVRRETRERARYQRDNDGHMGGLVEKVARDLVGGGPRAQITMPATWKDPDFGTTMTTPAGAAGTIEKLFAGYCRSIGLGRKLRCLHESRLVDGEGYGVLTTNQAIRGPVKLDLRLYECDQVDTPLYTGLDPLAFPGGRLDSAGNVTEWHFLKVHPGSDIWQSNYLEYDRLPADRVIHWYKARRAGQIRGITECAPGLPLYAYLRRYTLAVLGCAETAAKITGVMKVDAPPPPDDGSEPQGVVEMDQVPIPRNALLTTYGEVTQLKAEQPTTQYGAFRSEVLTEAGAGFGTPRNISTNSSAEYNYSSGRLDHLPYERMIAVLRGDLREVAMDRLFDAWLYEAMLIPGYLPTDLPPVETWSREWHYDGFDSIDPLKDAKTNTEELANGTTNLAEVYARRGRDWEESMRQRAREIALAMQLEAEMGLPSGSLSLHSTAPPATEVPDGAEQTSAA